MQQGLKLNECALFRNVDAARVAGETEEAIYYPERLIDDITRPRIARSGR